MRRRPVVLIVDDDNDTSDMYAAGLAVEGFESLLASTATDGLEIAARARPDAVVTDLGLPGELDGLALTERLRHDSRTQAMRIIVLTGSSSEVDRDAARRAGCDLFLTKPCLPDRLADALRNTLSSRSSA
jgi:DNA-binding response OmpR family regulator